MDPASRWLYGHERRVMPLGNLPFVPATESQVRERDQWLARHDPHPTCTQHSSCNPPVTPISGTIQQLWDGKNHTLMYTHQYINVADYTYVYELMYLRIAGLQPSRFRLICPFQGFREKAASTGTQPAARRRNVCGGNPTGGRRRLSLCTGRRRSGGICGVGRGTHEICKTVY